LRTELWNASTLSQKANGTPARRMSLIASGTLGRDMESWQKARMSLFAIDFQDGESAYYAVDTTQNPSVSVAETLEQLVSEQFKISGKKGTGRHLGDVTVMKKLSPS
jgi:hypothetical protein